MPEYVHEAHIRTAFKWDGTLSQLTNHGIFATYLAEPNAVAIPDPLEPKVWVEIEPGDWLIKTGQGWCKGNRKQFESTFVEIKRV